ncbi:MAG TPA: tRNA pseudouridine(13) synthase TruD [Gemmataceae bacterium]|jgi:tRNA pseudouridine13 synthase|nr:tRNA pseudouridine(13) synthase TruD [Gemmataceae bacterium]
MKIKERPEDFQVEELTDVRPQSSGPFALYRLEKQNLNTLDALQFVRRRWKIDRQRIGFGGLKDRHAKTVQYFTILHGPERQLNQTGLHVEYLGRVAEPFTSKNIRANRFRITIHDLDEQEIQHARQALEEVRRDGVPNYFDEQRFGSAGEGEFMARHLVHGRYEEALRLALTTPYEFDRGAGKKEKAVLRAHWGEWKKCLTQLGDSQARRVVEHLALNSADFHGALRFIHAELRHFYLNAYQSHLWNSILARWLESHCRLDQLLTHRLRIGVLPIHRNLDDTQRNELTNLRLPLPTARAKLDPTDPRFPIIQEVLKEEDLELRDLKVKGLREWFFSKGERAALCVAEGLKWETATDERHSGKQKMILSFDLPRGSYATLIIGRLASTPREQVKDSPC